MHEVEGARVMQSSFVKELCLWILVDGDPTFGMKTGFAIQTALKGQCNDSCSSVQRNGLAHRHCALCHERSSKGKDVTKMHCFRKVQKETFDARIRKRKIGTEESAVILSEVVLRSQSENGQTAEKKTRHQVEQRVKERKQLKMQNQRGCHVSDDDLQQQVVKRMMDLRISSS